MASPSSLLFIILLAIASADGQPAAPPPSSPINLTDILVRRGQYKTLLGLLNATQFGTQLTDLIDRTMNTSTDGFTLFAPTDDAFKDIPTGALLSLLPTQKLELLRYHVLPRFYTLQDFRNITNPVMTLASSNASGGAGYTLNFTVNSDHDEVNIFTGVVETHFDSESELYLRDPLAVFEVHKVLLPTAIFRASSPAPSPVNSSPANKPSNAGAGKMKYSEVVLCFMLVCALLVDGLLL